MKIAFFVQHMIIGGVEKNLLRLCDALLLKGHDISIYAIKAYGELIEQIPENVKFYEIPMESSARKVIPVGGIKIATKRLMSCHKYGQAMGMILRYLNNKTGFTELCYDLNKIPKLSEKYDIAVNYHIHSPFLVWYLSERIVSIKKYTWIHNDFNTTRYDIRKLDRYLKCMDYFFAVAENLRNEFIEIFPNYVDKTQVALNLIPYPEILKKGDEYLPKEYAVLSQECIKILTVGRLEEQKGYDIVVDVAEKLKEKGIVFNWCIIGEGTERKRIKKDIERKGLNNYIQLLGIKNNPYPYFKCCDIYVQTSRHEGYATTVSEAKVFCKPIITTDVSGAKEQIRTGENGFITSFDAFEIAEYVNGLCADRMLREKFSETIKNESNKSDDLWLSYFE